MVSESRSFLENQQKPEVGPKLLFFHSSCYPLPQEYKDLKGDGPFTVFVPHADLMTNMSQVTRPLEQGWPGTGGGGGLLGCGPCLGTEVAVRPPVPS